MNERGWGWTGSEIRWVQLLEWVAGESIDRPGEYVEVKAFYDARPNQIENRSDLASGDLTYLTEARLILNSSGIGGIETMAAMLTPRGHELVERLRAQRAHKGQRRAACRDALVSWLYAADATIIERIVLRDAMLEDPQHGMWLAAPFAPTDSASGCNARRSSARHVAGRPVCAGGLGRRRRLASRPGSCGWNWSRSRSWADSASPDRFRDRLRRTLRLSHAPIPGGADGTGFRPTVNIEHNSASFQVAGDHAHQVQQVGASAENLRDLIASIAELVRLAAPDADGLDTQRTAALAAAKDGAVDQSAIKRFAAWALAIIGKGASAALTPTVTAATNDMLHEAGRLAGHL